jgi:hypothetical protein
MSSSEIRRRRTGDPEMDAMAVITDALEPLDRNACKRVLAWAEKRFDRDVLSGIGESQTEELLGYFEKVERMAKERGLTQRQLLQVIAQVRERKGPPADPPLPDEEIEAEIDRVKAGAMT